MSVILGLDYGAKRIGVAVSDDRHHFALPSETIEVTSWEEAYKRIERLVEEKEVEKIVVGLPLSLAGTASEQTEATQNFICALDERVTVPVDFHDERLTTKQASREGTHSDDANAAAVMLQSYLDSRKQEP